MYSWTKKIAPLAFFILFSAGVAYAGVNYLPVADSVPLNWNLTASSTAHYAAVADDALCATDHNNTYISTSTSGTQEQLYLIVAAPNSATSIDVTPCVHERSTQARDSSKFLVSFKAINGADPGNPKLSKEVEFTVPSSSNPGWASLTPITIPFSYNHTHTTSSLQILIKQVGSGVTKISRINSNIQ